MKDTILSAGIDIGASARKNKAAQVLEALSGLSGDFAAAAAGPGP